MQPNATLGLASVCLMLALVPSSSQANASLFKATAEVASTGQLSSIRQALSPLLLTGKVSSIVSQAIMVPKAGDAWRYQIKWMLPEGSIAKAGEVVVIFDKSAIANRIEQLEASLLRVTAQEQSQSIALDAQILQAEFDLKQAQLELEKAQLDAGIPADYIPAKDYAENQFDELKAISELSKKSQSLAEIIDKRTTSLAQLQIDKTRAEKELDKSLKGLQQLEISSNIDGPILYARDPWSDKKFAVGDSVQIGRQVATIPAMKQLEVIAWVNEVDADRLTIGEPVNLRLDSQSSISLNGSIQAISRQATKQTAWGNSHWFRVEIAFSGDDRVKIIPGMSVLVEPKGDAS
ncbi:HlyD family efflux transporter periplasmic adaptor subunit [Shewanella abyssi]|uniref:HlyD family secretion protein n=1 Tax=Shewanella abyssi TaxID=311789 RepID=UPI00200D6A2A|nr:HlyD family efflux transporter periplasmic adaptor subunit [Shewanella abyssi]MCL1048026.1 HlyD family efflux transporter periplasmic adaptor subunit [Shewanella abyssi]